MPANVQIDFDAKNNTESAFTTINQGMELAKKAGEALKLVYENTIEPALKLGEATESLQNITGDTAEASSAFLGVMGDLGIGADQLTRVLDIAVKKGYSPNIEGLQKMRAEYQAIQDPIAQTKWLLDTFGKSGGQLVEYFKASDTELANLTTGVQNAGIVMSQDGVDAAREYGIKINQLKDAWTGLTVAIGDEAIPVLTKGMSQLELGVMVVEKHKLSVLGLVNQELEWAREGKDNAQIVRELTLLLNDEAGQFDHLAQAVGKSSSATHAAAIDVEGLSTAAWDASHGLNGMDYQFQMIYKSVPQATKTVVDFNAEVGKLNAEMGTGLTDATKKYNAAVTDLNAQWYETNAEVVKFQGTKYRTPEQEQQLNRLEQQLKKIKEDEVGASTAVRKSLVEQQKEIQKKIDLASLLPGLTQEEVAANEANKVKLGEIGAQIDANRAEYDKAQKSIIFGMIEQIAMSDLAAAKDDETKARIVSSLTEIAAKWGLIDTTTQATMNNATSAFEEFAHSDGRVNFDDLYNKWMGLNDKTITITTNMIYNQIVNAAGGGSWDPTKGYNPNGTYNPPASGSGTPLPVNPNPGGGLGQQNNPTPTPQPVVPPGRTLPGYGNGANTFVLPATLTTDALVNNLLQRITRG